MSLIYPYRYRSQRAAVIPAAGPPPSAPAGNASRSKTLYPWGYVRHQRTERTKMSTVAVTEDTFEDTVTRPGITLIDWWASWCGPCRMFAPVFQAASEKHPDITFGKVDTEDQGGLSAAARITSIPTLMAFRDGILVFSQPGALPAASLEKVIQAVRGLDMNEIRGKMAMQEGASRWATAPASRSARRSRRRSPGSARSSPVNSLACSPRSTSPPPCGKSSASRWRIT